MGSSAEVVAEVVAVVVMLYSQPQAVAEQELEEHQVLQVLVLLVEVMDQLGLLQTEQTAVMYLVIPLQLVEHLE